MRLSKLEYLMGIAEAVSAKSHDEQTKVGGVLFKNDSGVIVATGYNGFVRGAPDDILPKTRPEKHEFMVHCEENIISSAAKNGVNISDCTLVITMSPCQKCLRLLWQAGITDVVCKNLYRDHNCDMKDLSIEEEKTDEGYTRLKYTQK